MLRHYATQVVDETGEDYLQNIIDVAAGIDYCLALKQDGTVWSYGINTSGQLGRGNSTIVGEHSSGFSSRVFVG